jgi:hypothetical protein
MAELIPMFYSSSKGSFGGSAGIVYFSSAQAPRSICLQRSEQNGRYLFSSFHSTLAEQVGQSTTVAMINLQKLQRVSSNGTSSSSGLGFRSPPWLVNRTHNMYLLAEISGIAPSDSSSVSRSIWYTLPCNICW